MPKIALVGSRGSGRSALADHLRRDPNRHLNETQTPVLVLDLENAHQVGEADLILLLVGAGELDVSRQKNLATGWANTNKKVLILVNQAVPAGGAPASGPWVDWGKQRVVYGAVDDPVFLQAEFSQAVMDLLPNQLLALGRYFPLFRVPIAHALINDTCLSNAAYAISTGLAEIVPVLDIPLNVTDMVVLGKTQAFLVYKLGLALGFSVEWRDYVSEFGGVLGGGFFWRQLARGLVGLIPAWGIIPKVGVAYAGTYVVGNAVLQWYLTGRHISRKQMADLYRQAFLRGKIVAGRLVQRAPRLPARRRKPAALPAKAGPSEPERQAKPASVGEQVEIIPASSQRKCRRCGRLNAAEASFCQYCGKKLPRV